MEVVKAIGRFVLAQIAILAFLAAAPALMLVVPFVLIAHGDRNLGGLAFLYMAAGPFVSAAWTSFFMSLRRVYRTTTFGNRGAYKPFTMRVQLISCGWALYGFLGTLIAEVAFVLLYHCVSRSPVAFFAAAPFVVFSPLIAGSVWHARKGSYASGKSAETAAMQSKLRAASLRIACLKRNGKNGEEILGLLDGDDHEAVLFQASLDNMDELRACPAGSMGELVHKRNQRYLGEAC